MDVLEDGQRVTASLAGHLDRLTFADLGTDEVTELIISSVAGWATDQGWRVYHRAASVLPLPPPLSRRQSVIDVACARPDGPPVVLEVDHTNRQRTIDKLLAEAGAGRIAIWVRWGTGRFTDPPPPVHLVTCTVRRRAGPPGQGSRHSRSIACTRQAPAHTTGDLSGATPIELPMPLPGADRP